MICTGNEATRRPAHTTTANKTMPVRMSARERDRCGSTFSQQSKQPKQNAWLSESEKKQLPKKTKEPSTRVNT